VRGIIDKGGQHSGRSNLMPPWGEKLGRQLVSDVTDYVFTLPQLRAEAKASRAALDRAYYTAPKGAQAAGRRLYSYYCALCHGLEGKGDGIYADSVFARHGTRPRDLTDHAYMKTRTDKTLYTVISLGGMRTDRSPDMPAWDLQLTPAQTRDLVQYIRAISRATPAR
jgi:mono/diheme cytochrome c family protein